MPGPLYLTQRSDGRGSPPEAQRLPSKGPIELLVIHKFSRQEQRHHDSSYSKPMWELADHGRNRLDSIDSVLSTASSISSVDTSNAATISPITVLAEIYHHTTDDPERKADAAPMWQCRKHKTKPRPEVQARSVPIDGLLSKDDNECTCYGWTGGLGREVADGLRG